MLIGYIPTIMACPQPPQHKHILKLYQFCSKPVDYIYGKLDPKAGTYTFENNVVKITAKGIGDFRFYSWRVNGTEHFENPLKLKMDNNYIVIAWFIPN